MSKKFRKVVVIVLIALMVIMTVLPFAFYIVSSNKNEESTDNTSYVINDMWL